MLTVVHYGEICDTPSTYHSYDVLKKNKVEIVQDIDGTYGIKYKFGKGYSVNELAALNRRCDTIVFYGHCGSFADCRRTGPDVAFTNPREVDHIVKLVGTNLLHVKDIASDLARVLNTTINNRITQLYM